MQRVGIIFELTNLHAANIIMSCFFSSKQFKVFVELSVVLYFQ